MSRYDDDFRQPRRRVFDDTSAASPNGSGASGHPARSFGEPDALSGPAIAGTVKWYDIHKGFGFIELSDGAGDAFLHASILDAAGYQAVSSGAPITVQVGQGQKGLQVIRVLSANEGASAAERTRLASPPPAFGGFGRQDINQSLTVHLAGTVKWFNPQKGFGFVSLDDGGKDVFIHISVVNRAGLDPLDPGQRVLLRVVDTPKGREAVSINKGR